MRFPGQYYDVETGKHYNYFRNYDPSIGRYGESDPIGLKAGLNTYSYVRSNSLRRKDPLGLFEFESSCFGCKNDLEDWRNLLDHACKIAFAEVKDPALRECIQRRCEKGKVKCDGPSCSNKDWAGYNNEVDGVNEEPIYLCSSNQNNFRKENRTNLGCLAIHEWAHSCQWKHKQKGLGIPGEGDSGLNPIECSIKWHPKK